MASRRQRRSDSFVDDSFSDEDLDFINSQVTEDDSISMSSSQQQDLSFASSSRGGSSSNGMTPKNNKSHNVVDLTASSPVTVHGHHASTPIPKFGQPTQLVSQFTPVNNTSNKTKNVAAAGGSRSGENKHALNPSPHGSGGLGPKGRVGASSHAIGGAKYNNLFNDRGKNRPEFHRDLYKSSGPLKANGQSSKQPEIKRNSAGMQLFSSLEADREAAAAAAAAAAKPSPLQPGRATSSRGTAAAFGENVFYTDPDKAKEDLKALLEGGLEDEESEDEETKTAKAKGTAAKSGSKKKKEEESSIVSSTGHLPGLAVPLLPHQVEGVRWMINRELGPLKRGRVPKGGLLADDMGMYTDSVFFVLVLSSVLTDRRRFGKDVAVHFPHHRQPKTCLILRSGLESPLQGHQQGHSRRCTTGSHPTVGGRTQGPRHARLEHQSLRSSRPKALYRSH